jgi:hypothetical protein
LSFINIQFSSDEFWSKPKGQSFDEDPQFEELEPKSCQSPISSLE